MSAVAARAAQPFDLDAAAAAVIADAQPFPFTYRGSDYELPAQVTWPVEALAALGRGDLDTALNMLIGEAQTKKLILDGITVGHLNALFGEVSRISGTGDLPNFRQSAQRGSTPT